MKIELINGATLQELDTGVTLGKGEWLGLAIPVDRKTFDMYKFYLQSKTHDRNLTDDDVAGLLARFLTVKIEALSLGDLEQWRENEWE